MAEYELYHHGIKGMKWGVRKKKEKTIDDKFDKISNSKIRSTWHKRRALNIYKVNQSDTSKLAKSHQKSADKADRKINKIAENAKNKKYTSLKQVVKESNKGNKLIAKANEHEALAKEYLKMSKDYTKKIKDIKSGQLKAGKDFIVDWGLFRNEESVIDRKGKKMAGIRYKYSPMVIM